MSAHIPTLPNCARCGARIVGSVVTKREKSSGARRDFHERCWGLIEQSSAERAARSADARSFAQRRVSHLAGAVPSWAWFLARSELGKVIRSEKLRRFVERWKPDHGSVLMLGPSGVGKTTAAAALVRRLAGAAVESCARAANSHTPELELAARTIWTTGAALIVARREHALGVGEPPAIARPKAASLLILDELGHESAGADPIFLEVIDHRYTQGAPSIVTSGLTRIEFIARHGDALFRRLTERGTLIEEAR